MKLQIDHTMVDTNKTLDEPFNYNKGFIEVDPISNTSDGVVMNVSTVGGLSAIDIHNYLLEDELARVNQYDAVTQTILIICYVTFITFGAAGNGLVTAVVIRSPHMRTPRNIFIINLAISDLTLCLFTQPFNAFKLMRKDWPMGDFMCKLVPMFQGTNVFVSTISITAIALDRFQVIVYPSKDSMKKVGAAIALPTIWLISFLMASPLLIFNHTEPYPMKEFLVFTVCLENHDFHQVRSVYSIASMIVQYVAPIVIVIVAHCQICSKLRYRLVNQRRNTGVQSSYQRRKSMMEARRKRRTNMLLVMIAVSFAFSWMPLNVMNLIIDNDNTGDIINSMWRPKLLIALSHMLVLFSACANPVLYGWLNDNFKQEFMHILCLPCCQRLTRYTPDAENISPCIAPTRACTSQTAVAAVARPLNGVNGFGTTADDSTPIMCDITDKTDSNSNAISEKIDA